MDVFTRRRHCALVAGLLVLGLSADGTAAWAQSPKSSPYRPTGKCLSYSLKTDEVHRYESAVSPPHSRAGADISYYGNRLTQFQCLGDSAEAGMYASWEDYVQRHQLKPTNYRYRWRMP